jgi:hypothetical protein
VASCRYGSVRSGGTWGDDMRYMALIVLALVLAGCDSSPSSVTPVAAAAPKLSAPRITGPQCAKQVKAWLAQGDGTGNHTIGQDIIAIVQAAQNYEKVSPNSGDAQDDVGNVEGSATVLSYMPDPPSCADPAGYWVDFEADDALEIQGETSQSGITTDIQNAVADFGSLDAEIKQHAPGAQISVAQQ